MRQILYFLILLGCFQNARAQGIHFSQYYNAPQLLNPANTALMPDEDFQVGGNYRDQWSNVPAPFQTISVYGDFQAFRNRNITNWMGIGFGFFSDKAGRGVLSLNKFLVSLAYHIQMGESSMISAGLSAAYSNRSVDYSRLTFDAQWDGFSFNSDLAQNEPYALQSVNYMDLMAGVNYAFFPSESFYLKVGVGLQHINRPRESFYRQDNRLGMRPVFNADALIQINDRWIANPSVYYSSQKQASEIVGGSLFNYAISLEEGTQMIMGLFYRWNESFIPVMGLEWSKVRMMVSYDATTSAFSKANRSYGALEFSVSYRGLYGSNSRGRGGYNCPRF